MLVRVVQAPAPIVLPADLQGAAATADTAELAIAAVTGELDGPTGSLGRALGEQVLECTLLPCEAHCFFLPCPPIIEIQSVVAVVDGADVTLTSGQYCWDGMRFSEMFSSYLGVTGCASAYKIIYKAGYNGTSTGAVPDKIKQAIILKARQLISVLDASAFKKVDEIDGVGRWEYALPEQVARVIDTTVENLVAGLKVQRL